MPIYPCRSNGRINKADATQTGCEHFEERVEGYQEMFASLNRGPIQYITVQSKELIFTKTHGEVWIFPNGFINHINFP